MSNEKNSAGAQKHADLRQQAEKTVLTYTRILSGVAIVILAFTYCSVYRPSHKILATAEVQGQEYRKEISLADSAVCDQDRYVSLKRDVLGELNQVNRYKNMAELEKAYLSEVASTMKKYHV